MLLFYVLMFLEQIYCLYKKVFKKAKCTPPKSSNMFPLEFQITYLTFILMSQKTTYILYFLIWNALQF
jgi:hypothetical protein